MNKPIYLTQKRWESYHKPKNKSKKDELCSICHEKMIQMDKWDRLSKGLSTVELIPELKTLKCGHTYHNSCITKWLLINNTCPYCRTVISFFR
jgi:hypothetical protein